MQHPLNTVLQDPWRLLEFAVDGPLHPGGEAATDQLLDRAAVDAETKVLDVGCGAGESLHLARERGAHVVGLDREPTGTRTVRGDMNTLPFRADGFDVVLGECVLCLSPAFDQTLCEIQRVLRPEGRLALSDVTVDGPPLTLPALLDELLCLDGPREQAHIYAQIEQAGFDIVDVQTHREDLLAMRDRVQAGIDYERLKELLGTRSTDLDEGVRELESAVESGNIGYVSIVANNPS